MSDTVSQAQPCTQIMGETKERLEYYLGFVEGIGYDCFTQIGLVLPTFNCAQHLREAFA
jgi:hypothetical protein